MNIYLIGYRCTGKTTAGELLSEISGLSFVDVDEEIVKEAHCSIQEMVSREGWDSFRKKEAEVLKNISFYDRQVVSTGGGVILKKENIENMRKTGLVVWLRAETATILRRLGEDGKNAENRPPLTAGSLENEVEETLFKRMSSYERAMDFFVDTDDRDFEEICLEIMDKIKSRGINL